MVCVGQIGPSLLLLYGLLPRKEIKIRVIKIIKLELKIKFVNVNFKIFQTKILSKFLSSFS